MPSSRVRQWNLGDPAQVLAFKWLRLLGLIIECSPSSITTPESHTTSCMAETVPQKRRRPITICTECQRRKQRCDKQKPCGGCVARNVDERCVYPLWPEKRPVTVTEEVKVEDEDENIAVNLADSLGYSSLNKIKGTLDDLQQEYGNGSPTNGPGRAAVPKTETSTYDALVARLPSSEIIDDIIQVCFAEADWYFCVLDRQYYEELYSVWRSQRPSRHSNITISHNGLVFVRDPEEVRYFPALLFQVLALTLHFLPTSCLARDMLQLKDYRAADKLSKHYSDSGAEIMTQLGRIDSPISAVLADLLRCAWMKNSGLGTHSWHSLSDAIRQAQNLALHEQQKIPRGGSVDVTNKELWYDEHRRRVWTCLFAWDAHMAVMLGRSRMIHAEDCTATTPMDCDIPPDPSQVVPAPAIVSGHPSTYTSQLFKYTTALKLHTAMSSGALKSPCADYTIVDSLHNSCLTGISNLPSYARASNPDTSFDTQYPNLSKQRQQIAIVASAFFLAIHRPHVTHRAISRREAIAAALSGLTAQQCLFELCAEHHYKIHTLVFHTIDAVIFLTSMVLMYCQPHSSTTSGTSTTTISPSPMGGFPDTNNSDIPLHAIRFALLQAVSRFSIMRHRSDVAREGEKVLRRCSELVAKREREYRSRTAPQSQLSPPTDGTGSQGNGTSSGSAYINFLTDPPPDLSAPTTTGSTASSGVTPKRTPRAGDNAGGFDGGNGAYPPASVAGPGLAFTTNPAVDFDVDLPLDLDLDLGLDPDGNALPEYLYSGDMEKMNDTNMAVWMEQNGFVDDALLVGDGY